MASLTKHLSAHIGRHSNASGHYRMEVAMLRLRQGGKFSAAITNTGSESRQPKGSSRSWMTKYGIRRYYRPNLAAKCSRCKQTINRIYRLHPFVMPKSIGRGLWLDTDCRCALARQKAIREQLQKVTVKPEVSLPMPPALRNHQFDNFNVESFNRDAYTSCLKFATNFAKNRDGKGLILCGKAGRGKTHLACAILNMLKNDYTTGFAHIPTYLEQLRQGAGNIQQLIAVDLLVLDDLGSERESDWALEKLLVIVDGRLNQFKPTVYTTNFNLDELELRVGSRLASRILYNSLDLILQGPDWREIKYRQGSAL